MHLFVHTFVLIMAFLKVLHGCNPQRTKSPTALASSSGDEVVAWEESAEQVPFTIQAIRRRLQARLALHTQLLNLETATSTRYDKIMQKLTFLHVF